jgi:uncharacterized protein (TIGR00299 family) protein
MSPSANTVYLDCFSGISGDMLLGALINAGLAKQLLEDELAKLNLEPYDFKVVEKKVQSISATSVTIESKSQQTFRYLGDIQEILKKSTLEKTIIEKSLAVFQCLAEAEARVHGKPVNEIHFHEVGALDTIIDIVGTVTGLHLLGITKVYCSPLPLGRGFVKCAHGNLPLPAPAVCNLLKDVPVYGIDASRELVTPTGAALAAALADHYGEIPPMTPAATGYGAGDWSGTDDRPNLLRLIMGYSESVDEAQQVEIIETNLDDWSPEGFPFLCDRLFAGKALDVSLTPILMKKGRPGFCLSVIARLQDSHKLKEIILTETSAIGLRYRREQRMTLPRESVEVNTRWGRITAKKVNTSTGSKIYPEYESCRLVAEEHALPLDTVYREVLSLTRKEA